MAKRTAAVIGLGVVGGGVVRELSAHGWRMTGYDRFAHGHTRGSSHGSTRLIRAGYPDDALCRRMADAFALWREMEETCGETLLVRCGGLYIGTRGNDWIARTAAALAQNGVSHERLSRADVGARFPQFRLTENETALWEPNAGYIRADAVLHANRDAARAMSAEWRENVPVTKIKPDGGGCIVQTADGASESYDAVVVCAGPWMNTLLPNSLPLAVTRQQVVYAAWTDGARADFAPGICPVWVDADRFYYGFPDDGTNVGIKIAAHGAGDTVDPDDVNRVPDAAYIAEMGTYARERFAGVTGEIVGGNVCLYTTTPDEEFRIGRVPGFGNGWFASACSGHGFKFGVWTARVLADLADSGRSDLWQDVTA